MVKDLKPLNPCVQELLILGLVLIVTAHIMLSYYVSTRNAVLHKYSAHCKLYFTREQLRLMARAGDG